MMFRRRFHQDHQRGASIVGTMIAIGIIGIGTAVMMFAYQHYTYAKQKTRALKMIRDARATFVPAISEATKMFLAKGCERRSRLSNFGGFTEEYEHAREKFGTTRYAWMSLGDLTTNGDYSDLIGIDRPQTFVSNINEEIERAEEYQAAVNRCNRYSGLPQPDDSSTELCFEFGGRSQDAFVSGSMLTATAGLVEVRLEFADLVKAEPIRCREVGTNGKAAFSVKLLMHWVAGQSVVSHEEIIHVAH